MRDANCNSRWSDWYSTNNTESRAFGALIAKTWLRFSIAVLTLIGTLTASTMPLLAQPTERAVSRHVEQMLPHGVRLQSMSMRVFPDAAGGTGRVSVAGMLRADVDLFLPTTRSSVAERLSREGFAPREIDEYFGRIYRPGLVDVFFWERRMQAGGGRPFSGELRYMETASGVTFSGQLQHGLYNVRTLEQVQRTRATLPQRRAVNLINDDPVIDDLVGQVLRMREADRAQQEAERERAREALQEARRDFLDLIIQDLAWFSSGRRLAGEPLRHRLLARVSECRVAEENEALEWRLGGQHVVTVHSIRADCIGTTNLADNQGRFRFVDGLEIQAGQRRPMSIQFVFPTDYSHDFLRQWREARVVLCMEKIAEDVGRGGVFASRHTLGRSSCQDNVPNQALNWLPDRGGFTQGEYGWTIMRFDAALAALNLQWQGPAGSAPDPEPEVAEPAPSFVPHEEWFVPGVQFAGHRDGPDGSRQSLTMEVTASRQVQVTQGGDGCTRSLRLVSADGDTVTVQGRIILTSVRCVIEGTVTLRVTSGGDLHYEWRQSNAVSTGILTRIVLPTATVAAVTPDAVAEETPDDAAEATVDSVPHEAWFLAGAQFEGHRNAPDGTRVPLTIEVSDHRELRLFQGSDTCSRAFRISRTEDDTVILLGRHMIGRPDCRIGERLDLRGTGAGEVHYALRQRDGTVVRGVLIPASATHSP